MNGIADMSGKDRMNIVICVAFFKKFWTWNDPIYLPVHVGKWGKEDLGYIGDDTGDNISAKHDDKGYSELTGLYWAWKNLQCDYLGLCHYRRYFSRYDNYVVGGKMTDICVSGDLDEYLKSYDIILAKKYSFGNMTVAEQYGKYCYIEDLREAGNVIEDLYPMYLQSFDYVMEAHEMHACNMFVMKKELANEYCKWLFDILFELEKRIDTSEYDSYQKRALAFIAERIFNVWIHYHGLKAKELGIVFLD